MNIAHRPAIWLLIVLFVAIVMSGAAVVSQSPARNGLAIYLIDVEGGNATLFVTPGGESLPGAGTGGATPPGSPSMSDALVGGCQVRVGGSSSAAGSIVALMALALAFARRPRA